MEGVNRFEIIIGLHSIVEAILNPRRQFIELIVTEDSFKELKKRVCVNHLKEILIKTQSSQEFVKVTQKHYNDRGSHYQRIPSQICLIAKETPIFDFGVCIEAAKDDEKKMLKYICLDQVTDVHNIAAVIRTAAFYNLDGLIISQKGHFSLSPTFTRLVSGGIEHVKIIKCASLSKGLRKLSELGVCCLGLSEHSQKMADSSKQDQSKKRGLCLVLGAEDVGLSNAVSRVLDETLALSSQGKIASLNVSVAAGIAMDRFF